MWSAACTTTSPRWRVASHAICVSWEENTAGEWLKLDLGSGRVVLVWEENTAQALSAHFGTTGMARALAWSPPPCLRLKRRVV